MPEMHHWDQIRAQTGFMSIGLESSVTNFRSVYKSTFRSCIVPVRTFLVSITAVKPICLGKQICWVFFWSASDRPRRFKAIAIQVKNLCVNYFNFSVSARLFISSAHVGSPTASS